MFIRGLILWHYSGLMSELETAKTKAATTYNAAADSYDHPANTFWERYGRRTIERLGLTPGQRVLDVCCGSELRPSRRQNSLDQKDPSPASISRTTCSNWHAAKHSNTVSETSTSNPVT